MLVATLFSLIIAEHSSAQLTWGAGGAGGSGTWNANASNTDWWNGSANVAWSTGDAIFAGTSGTVTVSTPAPTVNSMTFNTAGYVIQSGTIKAGVGGLTITTNADAAISSTLASSLGGASALVKDGDGTLSVGNNDLLRSLQVNGGQFLATGSTTLAGVDVALADAAGVTLALAPTNGVSSIGSLSGGGSTGGIVQPGTTTTNVRLTTVGSGNFGGILKDNGAAQLALTISLPAAGGRFISGTGASQIIVATGPSTDTQVLGNANTYSGETEINSGTLSLSGNGMISDSTVTVSSLGALVLDNTAVANANRISSSAVLTLGNSGVQLIGNGVTAVNQLAGTLSIQGATNVTVTQSGGAVAQLTFAGFTRNAHATLNVVGSGVLVSGLTNDSSGIVTPAVTVGNDWASIGGDERITAYSSYAPDINAASPTGNVELASSGVATLAAPVTRNSLNLQNSSAGVSQVLDLGGRVLGLSSGGLLTSGSGASVIQNGSLSTTAPEWVITANNNLTISAPILESNTATDLTKSGTGTLTLSGTNTYAGTTSIDQGTLIVSSDSNLGTGANVEFGGGTLEAAASFSSTKGLTKTSPLAGNIDTNGFTLTFSGVNSGAINKVGSGTLTLSNASTGTTFATAGTLVLSQPTSGTAYLHGGILQAAGTLSNLTFLNTSTLDIGGLAATTLSTTAFAANGSPIATLTIDFGVGGAGKDLWAIGGTLPVGNLVAGELQFDFQDLGGAGTGVSYQLMTFASSGSAPSQTLFAIAPDSAAKGWAGTFTTTNTSASVSFTATPEPNVAAILACGGVALMMGERRFRSGRPRRSGFTIAS